MAGCGWVWLGVAGCGWVWLGVFIYLHCLAIKNGRWERKKGLVGDSHTFPHLPPKNQVRFSQRFRLLS